ncbi:MULTISPECIES: hypothetical protein [Streptococcus]|uniref:Uncharacterized protein n=1 Tax=Streptococcus macedonicus TaxID=59310 RepID=A0A1C3SRS6_STRMC|nr:MULTISPECIES: hypothetical protein [Streptococcus]CCF03250.1 Hypothetical protein SMA_1959 [Streptococcus macedonicus ACA-DC 198]MCW8486826.1 hypothetical protein [Streptococcus macedonicus]MCW8495036.1 hypothetical protein [Streptococcus macedonicus]MCW8500289.1 hypothetical protein [Streptococcus macedonicus]MCW8502043.1 hypothetical protein [Streptococcus macedonicus]
MVVNSILETMQGIAAEAKPILADYDAKVQGLRSQFTKELECIETDCDKKTQIEVEGLSKELAEKTAQVNLPQIHLQEFEWCQTMSQEN